MRWFPLLLCACATPPADLGEPCVLVREGPDGGPVPILQSDSVIANQAGDDVLSFGVSGCSSHICVRDSHFVEGGGTGPEAHGYCSASCGPCGNGLTCRALLLDSATLMALKTQFESPPSSDFCARP
jgi:hypothetical protein